MTITLKPEIETRLKEEAKRRGMEASEYAGKLIDAALEQKAGTLPNQATLELLAQWDKEDETDDPQEIARRQREGEEFMRSLAQSRIDMEGPNARKLWPPQS